MVGPAPFPGHCGKGGGRGPWSMSGASPAGAGSAAGPRGGGALLVLQLVAALGLSELFGQVCFGFERSGGVCLRCELLEQ